MALKEAFDLDLSPAEARQFRTVGDVVERVSARR